MSTSEPEYCSDAYLLKKWEPLLSGILSEDKLLLSKLLEAQSHFNKTPLQIFAEEANRE